MESAIHSDLAFEQDAEQAAADLAKQTARTGQRDNSNAPAEDDSSDYEAHPAEPINPPVEEPPVYSNQEGPPPPPARPARPDLLVAFLVLLVGLGGTMAVLEMYLGYIALPDHWSMQGSVSWAVGFLTALYGISRRWCHPWCIAAAVAFVLIGFCNAEATLDLQVPGGPPLSLTGFDSFRPSPLVRPSMHDFLCRNPLRSWFRRAIWLLLVIHPNTCSSGAMIQGPIDVLPLASLSLHPTIGL
jgi:hypothetical protein